MKADVGVIIGRFQVDKLHPGHEFIIQQVVDNHPKVIVFLGLTPLKCTIRNPLDFESRKQMLLEKFPNINVLYVKDHPSDNVWSSNLDDAISDLVGPSSTVALYGSRDSFIKHYHGKHECIELDEIPQSSGTMIRDGISKEVRANADFRSGVIWATKNQFVNAIPVVDVAIFNSEGTKVLLCRKPEEPVKFQFIGGFANAGEDYEAAARREAREETGNIEVGPMIYVGSAIIDDWRYRGEVHKLTTVFYRTTKLFGAETARDDIEELRWFSIDELDDVIRDSHKPLLEKLKGAIHA